MKYVIAFFLSLMSAFAGSIAPESCLYFTETHDIGIVGKLDKPKIITVLSDDRVVQIGGSKIIKKEEYSESGSVVYSMEITPKEVIHDPRAYFKNTKTITVFWTKQVNLKKGAKGFTVSMCPPISYSALDGEEAILLFKRSTMGYEVKHSIDMKHLQRIKDDRIKRTKETERLDKIIALQSWQLPIWDLATDDPFEEPSKELLAKIKTEQVKSQQALADITAASFLFAVTYPLRNYGPLIINDADVAATKPYMVMLNTLRGQYKENPYHRKQVLVAMDELLQSTGSLWQYSNNMKTWSSHKEHPLEHGFNERFIKLAKLLNAPEHLFLPQVKTMRAAKAKADLPIKVTGSVKHPADYKYNPKKNKLIEVIQQAGGFTKIAFIKRVRLTRNDKTYLYDLRKNSHQELRIYPGDIINVPTVRILDDDGK